MGSKFAESVSAFSAMVKMSNCDTYCVLIKHDNLVVNTLDTSECLKLPPTNPYHSNNSVVIHLHFESARPYQMSKPNDSPIVRTHISSCVDRNGWVCWFWPLSCKLAVHWFRFSQRGINGRGRRNEKFEFPKAEQFNFKRSITGPGDIISAMILWLASGCHHPLK